MDFKKKKLISQKLNVHFFIVALAIAVGVYIALADSGKYISKLDILLLPKNEKTAIQIDKIRGNIFVIFEKTSELEDVTVKIEENDTLINIESKKYDRSEAMGISKKASQEIINIASKYYSVKSDLDLRIVKGDIQKNKNNIFIIIFLSAILGGIISFIVQFIVDIVESSATDFMKKRKDASDVSRDIEEMLMKNKSKIEELSYSPEKEEVDFVRYPVSEVTEIKDESVREHKMEANFKKASSPQNLPVESFNDLEDNSVEEVGTIPGSLPFEVIDEEVQVSSIPKILGEQNEEPTEEEYRERLNQLLKGE